MDLGRTRDCLVPLPLLLYLLLSLLLSGILATDRKLPLEVTRQNIGDVFRTEDMPCSEEWCVGLSSGTAGGWRPGGPGEPPQEEGEGRGCGCRCHGHLPVFREDLAICVDDIHECVLAPFVGGSTIQKIPFVFLPLKGQIIHPSKEIRFAGIERPVCAVSGAKYLTETGWTELRNVLDLDVPFRLYRDEGRTFLQWVGEPELRSRMSGRLVLVYLMCRDVSTPEEMHAATQNLFSPCVAFRVVGSPKRHILNISEVTFFPDARSSSSSGGEGGAGGVSGGGAEGLGAAEYAAIGACSALLGLVYAASVLLYLHLRRNRARTSAKPHPDLGEAGEEAEGVAGGGGVVKSNPLLAQHRFAAQESLYNTDGSGSDGELAPDLLLQRHGDRTGMTTSALIHPSSDKDPSRNFSFRKDIMISQDQSPNEKLPEENVSIIETLEGREDRSDSLRALTGNTRKKLYFNPAYFEPQLLLAPPPAALEFLCKIREVIGAAKLKMAVKRFTPSLSGIPEEDHSHPVEMAQEFASLRGGGSSRRSSLVSLKRENSRRRGAARSQCEGCPGCHSGPAPCGPALRLPDLPALGACRSCGGGGDAMGVALADNKQQSIRRWLEGVPLLGRYGEEGVAQGQGGRGPRRIRSPARSLPPDGGALYARPVSPRAASEMADVACGNKRSSRHNRHKSAKSEDDCSTTHRSTRSSRHGCNTKMMSLPPPDMIHEAMALDSRQREPRLLVSKEGEAEEEVRIPTITRKNMRAVIDELHSHGQRLTAVGVPYESDSLEKNGRRTPSDYAEIPSSQHSPSLSAALPMAEELTMRNAVFEKTPAYFITRRTPDGSFIKNDAGGSNGRKPHLEAGIRSVMRSGVRSGDVSMDNDDEPEYELVVVTKDGRRMVQELPGLMQRGGEGGGGPYSLVSEVYVNSGYSCSSGPSSPGDSPGSTMGRGRLRVRYEGQPGKLLIEVEDCPDNYIPVCDEDTFEPDTLDRKPATATATTPTDPTTGGEVAPRPLLGVADTADFADSLERPQQILLRSSGSFRRDGDEGEGAGPGDEEGGEGAGLVRGFGSLREIYEARLRGLLVGGGGFALAATEGGPEGRMLTLEERQRRRQRNDADPDAVRPDVIPPPAQPQQPPNGETPLYERPKPPRKVLTAGGVKSEAYNHSQLNGDMHQDTPAPQHLPVCNKQQPDSPVSTPVDDHHHYDVPDHSTDILSNLLRPEDTVFPHKNDHVVFFTHQTSTPAPVEPSRFKFSRFSSNKRDKHNPKKAIKSLLRPQKNTCHRIEDSGYLSTDSNESRYRLEREGGSETEDSFGDGHSESGAESVETHSVFFDIFRRRGCGGDDVGGGGGGGYGGDRTALGGRGFGGGECNTASMDSGLATDARSRDHSVIAAPHSRNYYNDPCSDSETVSYATVVPFGSNVSTLSSNNGSSVTRR